MYLSIQLEPDFDNDQYSAVELLYRLVYADGMVLASDLDAQVALQLREDCQELTQSEARDYVEQWCTTHRRHDPQLIAARDARIQRQAMAARVREVNSLAFENFRAARLRAQLGPHRDYLDLLFPEKEEGTLTVTQPKHRNPATQQFFLTFK